MKSNVDDLMRNPAIKNLFYTFNTFTHTHTAKNSASLFQVYVTQVTPSLCMKLILFVPFRNIVKLYCTIVSAQIDVCMYVCVYM